MRKKLVKLAKGHYQNASAQHLLIYDDMDTAAIHLAEALRRLQPRLSKQLRATKVQCNTISVVSTQGYILFDIGGSCNVLRIPAEVEELPPEPNTATLMPDLARLWDRIDEESFWMRPSTEAVNLYRKLEQDFRSLQSNLDEDSRTGIGRAIREVRELLHEKIKDI